jgi:hypothetical protein
MSFRIEARAQPWRCLCRGFGQITITTPWRRITLHLSQIGLTLGLTFIVLSTGSSAPGGQRVNRLDCVGHFALCYLYR